MKAINFSSLLQFKLPDHWIAEAGEDGVGVFYDPADEQCTLRLKLMSVRAPAGERGDLALTALRLISKNSEVDIDFFPDGVRCLFDKEVSDESNTRLINLRWCLSKANQPSVVTLATFTFSTPESTLQEEEVLQVVGMLDKEIRKSKFIN